MSYFGTSPNVAGGRSLPDGCAFRRPSSVRVGPRVPRPAPGRRPSSHSHPLASGKTWHFELRYAEAPRLASRAAHGAGMVQLGLKPILARGHRFDHDAPCAHHRKIPDVNLLRRRFADHAYVSLDSRLLAEQAEHAPQSFLRDHPPPVVTGRRSPRMHGAPPSGSHRAVTLRSAGPPSAASSGSSSCGPRRSSAEAAKAARSSQLLFSQHPGDARFCTMTDASREGDWMAQAENDLSFARHALTAGHYAQCCFVCQQAAEKALKSLLMRRGAKAAFTHSLYTLCTALKVSGDVESASKKLDRYYVSARYPDALPGGAPYQVFQQDQAAEAVRLAETILDAVRGGG